MSKGADEILKELSDFAEKASAEVKADKLIEVAPFEALRGAFRAACNVAIALAKGELKPENVPDNAPELALIVMGVVAAKRMGIDPEELFGKNESPEKTSGEAGKPEQSAEEKRKACEVHVISGPLDEIMAKISNLLNSDN